MTAGGGPSPAVLPLRALSELADGKEKGTAPRLGDPQAGRDRRKAAGPAEALPELRQRLGAQYLASMAVGAPDPLLINRVDPTGHTILYGTGGSGKGLIGTSWMAQLTRAGHKIVIADYENHGDEWARRYDGLAGREGADRILWVPTLTASWGGRRGALWHQEKELRALADAFEATLLLVDSIVPACGGADPIDPGVPARYAAALEFIGRPAISLGHVPKAGGLEYPFASVFWHNLARVTWSLEEDGPRRILTHRKANNYRRLGKFAITVTWRDDLPREIWEEGYSAALGDRIAEALGEDALTVTQIVARLADELDDDERSIKPDSVRKALRRGLRGDTARYTVDGSGDSAKWSLA